MRRRYRRRCCGRFPWQVFLVVGIVVGINQCDGDDRRTRRRAVERAHELPAVERTATTTAAGATHSFAAMNAGAASAISGEPSLARNLYLVFDASSSMAGHPGSGCLADGDFATRLDGARAAVRELWSDLPGDVNAGLFVFDRTAARERVPLGHGDTARLRTAVDEIIAGGRGHLDPAIRFATDQLVEQRARQAGYGEFRLLVLTDEESRGLRDATAYAARRGIPVYAVGLCLHEEHPMREHVYSFRAAASYADLGQALDATLDPPSPFEPAGEDGGAR